MHTLDSALLLDDVRFADFMLNKGKPDKSDIVFIYRNLLKLKYFPVGVKYIYSQEQLERFTNENRYKTSVKALTYCHYSAASRQDGDILLLTSAKLGCSNAKYIFGWKGVDQNEIKSHMKYAITEEQSEKFVTDKTVLPAGLLAIATAPLHKAIFEPDIVHIICDVLQSYHLCNDYASTFNAHPIRPNFMINSAACGGSVWSHQNQLINVVPACSGSYTSGKTEQGELNVFIPGAQMEALTIRLLERTKAQGGASFPRTGSTYPGFDVCKLCPILTFKEPES